MTSAVSVKDRLKNHAMASGMAYQQVLIAYGLERTIYRLSQSEYVGRFTLKGGIFLYALFDGEFARATRDIDLLAGNMSNNVEDVKAVFQKIFSIECDDALKYDLSSLEIRDITEFKKYHGVNVSVRAYLDRTKIPVSVDIGFDDVIYPERVNMEFPTLLDMDMSEIYAYSISSVISEKFEAIVSLGDANSRYKDFYDIYILADRYDFEGNDLREALVETFDHRGTGFGDIYAFTEDFVMSEIHQRRWKAFQKKKKTIVNVELNKVVNLIRALLLPIVESIVENKSYSSKWDHESQIWK